ncbi:protein of unknown function [Nocardia cyriacigeorgica GUH-2]|uniref:Uncharacterized protein n=1 Tax=Nocardia cyriacigeorgica (strain GUH-2) TaxID=1127134 RepID=H6RCA2_NOCCG|nr:protein of unknown function [Nocardia cyriacigeorgica GUH-2]
MPNPSNGEDDDVSLSGSALSGAGSRDCCAITGLGGLGHTLARASAFVCTAGVTLTWTAGVTLTGTTSVTFTCTTRVTLACTTSVTVARAAGVFLTRVPIGILGLAGPRSGQQHHRATRRHSEVGLVVAR